eukprot:11043725-Lingulodinium_polyedra.AAC.1
MSSTTQSVAFLNISLSMRCTSPAASRDWPRFSRTRSMPSIASLMRAVALTPRLTSAFLWNVLTTLPR